MRRWWFVILTLRYSQDGATTRGSTELTVQASSRFEVWQAARESLGRMPHDATVEFFYCEPNEG